MRKCLAKIDKLEAWQTNKPDVIVITGLANKQKIEISRSEFFLLEKLMTKVVRGFINGS